MIRLSQITKTYGSGSLAVPVLRGIDLEIGDGEFVAIMGPSGSGKSTLMNIIGFLDKQTGGTYSLNGEDVKQANEKQLAGLRNRHIGFVFQQFFLLPRLNAQKNVETPLLYAGVSKKERSERALGLLEKVGLKERTGHLPSELSGGQKQRVAIARALVNQPTVILADEPTGALDSKTGAQIMELLTELNREGKTVIIVTHEEEIAACTDRIIVLRDGLIVDDRKVTS
ncbi:putative ABC transport system ATP-binding protein [Bhargavaea ginsengi]|uniref:Putative ABC transport system ATP-binding protein n=1 Tax=Bhargavaea ginsengi TaxID=426757 RepID=A0A1H7BRA9_9BACL|nr:ABC transporter ATP-binding protein [Bhargavaea ginsengi]MCM3089020.1 ABC transporter ATP-binding protein [Bhargavaea ginsengi]SEJ80021.1 putative ABC transport system ATP-binding protein [Bhargavaea ginsengi]